MRKFSKGFTLIELMVVVGVTALLGAIGIAGFVNYNQVQTLQNAASDLANTLNLARSRALSQVKLGTTCSSPTQILEGYSVEIFVSNNTYTLNSRCSGVRSSALTTKVLPQNVTFKTPDTSPTSFFFPVFVGGVSVGGQIVITGFGKDKTITVDFFGRTSIK